jgi:photosystem II stability/assembly factor-like uncharacterized protein
MKLFPTSTCLAACLADSFLKSADADRPSVSGKYPKPVFISLRSTKIHFLLLCGFCFCFSIRTTLAQWTTQSSGTSQDLHEILFVTPDTGYVVGNAGTVLKTTNGGQNWLSLQVGTNRDLHELFFLNARKGWVVGDAGTVAHTSDGGLSWNVQTVAPGASPNLRSVYALNATEILVGGLNLNAANYIYKSINGGFTWQPANVETYLWDISFQKIGMTSPEVGYALTRGMVVKTTDGGLNWFITDTASVRSASMFSILEDFAFFPGSDTLVVCGWYTPYVGKTVNGATNWQHNDDYDYMNLDFISPQVGYVGGWGHMHKTTDGGQTFFDVSGGAIATFSDLESIDFTDELQGYGCGKNGRIIHTSTGGVTSTAEPIRLLSAYPNPTAGRLRFPLSPEAVLTDLQGRIVLQGRYIETLNLSSQSAGFYVLTRRDEKGQVLQRQKIQKAPSLATQRGE